MMVVCPNHHDQCTKGAILEPEQRSWKAKPFNIERGYVDGQLKINQSYCAVACGSCLMVNDGTQVRIDGEPLLSLSLDEGRVQLSLTLYDEHDAPLAIIQNEWVSGDPSVWDLEATYQRLTVRRKAGDVRLRLNVAAEPMRLRAQLHKNGHLEDISPQGIFVNSLEAAGPSMAMEGVCFVAMRIDVDTTRPAFGLVPDSRYGGGSMVVGGTPLDALVRGVNSHI